MVALQLLEQRGDFGSQIVDAGEVALLGLRAEGFIVFDRPAGFGVDLVEVKTENALKDSGQMLQGGRTLVGRFDDLNNPRLAVDVDAFAALGGLIKIRDLSPAPIGLQIARRQDRNHDPGVLKLLHDLLIVDIISLEFRIAPDRGRLAH